MGSRFQCTNLKSLSLCIQLNPVSMHCSNPITCHIDLHVFHYNGLHDVAISFCGCEQAISKHIQLLWCGFYPATQEDPWMCATFTLLDQLHHLALTSKASTYDMYQMLEKSMKNTGDPPKSKYLTLMHMILQWCHLKLLK